MSERTHKKLTKCHVLFLGNSGTDEPVQGLKTFQQPLMKCYPVDQPDSVEGIDSWLTIFTSGFLLQFVSSKAEQAPVWFPIQNLQVVAATKCVNYMDGHGRRLKTEFADINSTAAKISSHPPLFSVIMKRNAGQRDLQCYTFLVQDEAPAVAMVEAAKYAFVNKSGWVNGQPSDEVIRNELVTSSQEQDEIDEFDSVSTAGHLVNKAPQNNTKPNGSHDLPDANLMTFPTHLVKRYTLSYMRRGNNVQPSFHRQPIPEEFMPHQMRNGGSVRSSNISYNTRGLPQFTAGSMRGTVTSVREIHDPRTRTRIIERVIQEPVPVPVYQPPQVIREVKPVYIPQPPEIRHIPIEVEKPVPVPYPVPIYPSMDDMYGSRKSRSKHKSSHERFQNHEIFDDRFHGQMRDGPTYFMGAENTSYGPQNYYDPYLKPQQKKGKKERHKSPPSSDDEQRRYQAAWNNFNPYVYRQDVLEINEVPSNDNRGNQRDSFSMRNLDQRFSNFHIHSITDGRAEQYVQDEFRWASKKDKTQREHQEVAAAQSRPNTEPPPQPLVIKASKEERQDKHKKDKHIKGKTSGQERISTFLPDNNDQEYYFKEHTEGPPRNWMDQQKGYMNERAFSTSVSQMINRLDSNAYALNHDLEDDTIFDRPLPPPVTVPTSTSASIPLPPTGGIPPPPPLPPDGKISNTKSNAALF